MRVLVTRAEDQGRATKARLEAAGLDGVVAPLTRIVLDGDVELDLDQVQAILVTSLNGVAALALNPAADRARALPLLAVGERTARAARDRGFADVASAAGDRHALAALAADRLDPARGPLLWAAGADRTADLVDDLEARGFTVRVVELYRAEAVATLPDGVAADLAGGRIDAIAVYSPRSAEILVEALAARGFSPTDSRFRIHAISEATAEPLRRAGYARVVVAERPDEPGLLVTFVQSREPPEPGDDAETGRSHMAPKTGFEPEKHDPAEPTEATRADETTIESASVPAETAEETPVDAEMPAAPLAEEPVAEIPAETAPAPEDATPPPPTDDAATPAEPAPGPVAETPVPPPAPTPAAAHGIGGGTLIGGLIVAALAGGVIGIGGARVLAPQVDALLGPAAKAPDPALKAATDRLAALEAKVAADEKKVAETPVVDLAPIEKRIAAIEAAPALKLPADLAARVDTLQKAAEERLAAAKTSVAEGLAKLPAADGATLADLASRVDAAIAAARESAAAEVAALSARLDATREDLKARGADGGEAAKAALADAATRLAAEVEKQKAEVAAALDGMRQRLGGVEGLRAEVDGLVGRLGGLETSNTEAKADRGRIAESLDQTLEATEGRVGSMESKLAKIEAGAEAATKAQAEAVFAVALADLKSAVDAGRPFGPEWEVVKRAAPEGVPALAPLEAFVATGVPSPTKLREDLPKVARAMVEADEAASAGSGFLDRMMSHAASIVRVRPAGESAGESLSAKVSRIESRLASGDLPAALAAWKALPDGARAVSAKWGAALEARVAVDAALAAQTAGVVSKLSQPK